MKCDHCNKPAAVHMTEIKAGKQIAKHLCEECAARNEGVPVNSYLPINELLTDFVMRRTRRQEDNLCISAEPSPALPETQQNGFSGCVVKSEGATHEM